MRPSRRPARGAAAARRGRGGRPPRQRRRPGRAAGGGDGIERVAIADARRHGASPLRAGSNVNWRTASSAAASSSSPAGRDDLRVGQRAVGGDRQLELDAAPSGGVPSGRFASTNFVTRGGVSAAGCAASGGLRERARRDRRAAREQRHQRARDQLPLLRSSLRTSRPPRGPSAKAVPARITAKPCRLPPRSASSTAARDNCPPGHATGVRARGRRGRFLVDALAARAVQRQPS